MKTLWQLVVCIALVIAVLVIVGWAMTESGWAKQTKVYRLPEPNKNVTVVQTAPDTLLYTIRVEDVTYQHRLVWQKYVKAWKWESMPIIIVDPRT